MKQSTFSAVMANSIKNLLQGYTKGIRFVAVLTVLLTMGIGQAWGADTWTLVKDVSELAAGDEVVIAASGSNYALGTTQNNNNRAAVSITKSGDNITWTTAVQVLTLKEGTVSGTFAFYTGSGYLYAASSSSNHLKTQTTNNANGSWKITITANGVATIKASGTNSRNWLRYNGSNTPVIFSCYSSGQNDVAIYKKQATVTNTLSSITLSGQTTTYNVGDSFSFDGTCTAKYSDGSTKTVTPTSVSSPDMNNAGTPTVTVSYTEGGVTAKATYTITVSAVSSGGGECTWELVTDASTLKDGDRVVIAAKDYNYAISTTQGNNNRGQAAITKSGNTIAKPSSSVQVLTLKTGKVSNSFAFYTGSGYLYAASSSSNYLRTENTLSNNSSWAITIADGTATLKAQGSYTRNVMQYNQSSSIFACYSSASQKALVIYKEVCTTETAVYLYHDDGTISEGGWILSGNKYTKTVETTNDNVVLPTPVKEGYTFGGWYDNPECTGTAVTEIEAGTIGTKEFYAKWTINRYTLTWNLNGGKVIVAGTHASVDATGSPSGYVNYNVSVNAPEVAKEGHYFTGWTEDGTNVVTPLTKMPARDVTYIALWEEAGCPEYSFHTGGDNVKEINTQICFEPVGSNNEWQIVNYVIPADTKYFVGHHGYWYENNLGSNNSRSVVKTWSEAMYLAPAMDPSNPNGTPKVGQATGAVGTIRIFENSNWDNLYVGFIPNGYKLKFSANEYDFVQHENTDYRSKIVEYNGSPTANYSVSVGITDADGNYVKTDHSQEDWRHIFVKDNVGWRNDGAKIGLYYWNNSTSGWCSEFLKSVPGETNLFEGWIPVAATKIKLVRYNSSKGNPGDWNDIWNQTGDISLVTTSNQFTISSWDNQTSGWSTYSSKGRFRMYNDSKSKNWYVHFYPHYVLKYDANGGEDTMEMQAVPKDASDKKVTIADCGFTRTGYNFVKWNKNASGTSTSYNPGVTYTLSADVILYAQWEAQTYNITYKDQGNVAYSGSNAASLPNTHTYATATTLVDGVKIGYTFGGWYDNPECTGTAITQLGATDYTADITLYAKWTINSHTLTWYVNGGNTLTGTYTSGSVAYGTVIVPPATPTRTGHTFLGWSPAFVEGTTMPDNDLTYTAQWQINQYTVTLNPNYPAGKTGTFKDKDGNTVSGNLVLTYDYNTASKTIEDLYTSLTLDGYELGGWYNAKGSNPGEVSGSKCTTTGNITGDKTYYAKWTKLYSITLSENGTTTTPTTQTSTSYTLPIELSEGTCENDEKALVGWSTVAIPTPGDKPASKFYELGETVTLTADQTTFYAVFATVGEGGGNGNYIKVTSEPTDWSGDYLIVANGNCFDGSRTTTIDANGNYQAVTISNNEIASSNTTDSYIVSISKSTNIGKYYIKTKSGYYIGSTATNDNELLNSTTTKYDNTISISGNDVTIKGTNSIFKFYVQSGQTPRFRYYKSSTNTTLPHLYKKSSGTFYSDYTTTCVKLPDPVLSFATEPANPIVFTDAVCGGNSSKQSVTVIGENLRDVVNVSVTGPYKIARTSSTALKDFTTSLTLDKTTAGAIHSNYQTVYIISTPPAQSTEATTGTLTFTTTKGNTLIVNLSTPIVTCTQYTLTLVDRGVSTLQPETYFAGQTINEAPADPEGVCTDPIHYVFDGWAAATVAEGSTTYTKVTFPHTVTGNTKFYAVYRYVEEGSADSGDYVKLTEDLDDYSGDYLIVYEAGKVAFDGGLDELDGTENTISVTINSNTIASNATTDAAKFTIAKVDGGYSIQSASGYYIGWSTADKNGLNANSKYNANYYLNTISNSIISGVKGTLKFNKTSGQERFRYYQSGQETIALYRKAASYLYTTSPVCGPHLVITEGKEIYVTGGNAGAARDLVMASQKVSYQATRLKTQDGSPEGTAPDVKVATNGITKGGVVTTEVKVTFENTVKELQPDDTYTITGDIVVTYEADANNMQEDIQVQLAVDYPANADARDNFIVHARSLPSEFVIVAKSGDKWYALNADMSSSKAQPANGQVTLNDLNNPTEAIYAPCNAIYTFEAMPQGAEDRKSVRFIGMENKYLWAASEGNNGVQNYSKAPAADALAYNWKLYTEDNITYHFGNAQNTRMLGLHSTNVAFGMYANGASVVQDIRILPYVEKCIYNYAPTNLTVTDLKGTHVTLTWDGVVGATKYQYSDDATNWTDCGTEPTVTITSLKGGTTYTYYIRAYHEDTGVSNECIDYEEITFTTADCDDVPTNISYSADLSTITVTWTASSATSTVKLYSDKEGTTVLQTTEGTNSVTFEGLIKNTQYYVQVFGGGSCASAIIPAKTKDVEMDVVEWMEQGIIVDVNTNEKIGVTLENEVAFGTGVGKKAEDIFFSKYFEANGTAKILAIYNGTDEKIDLSTVSIFNDLSGQSLDLAEFGHKEVGYIYPNEEIILFNKGVEAVTECSEQQDSYSDWYNVEHGVLNFGGRATLILKRGDAVIDIIGSIETKGTNYPNDLVGTTIYNIAKSPTGENEKPSWGDDPGWVCESGDNIMTDVEETDYPLSTNRCLLVRKNTVVSGVNAVTNNIDKVFATLCDEWVGLQIPQKAPSTDKGVTESCEGMAFVGDFDYSSYYTKYVPIGGETTFEENQRNPDGTLTVPITDLYKQACRNIKVTLKDEHNEVIMTREYKVPIMITTDQATAYTEANKDDNAFYALQDNLATIEVDENGDEIARYRLTIEQVREICKTCDVVIRDSATLTKAPDDAANDHPQVNNVFIYEGASLVIPDGTNETITSLSLRRKGDIVASAKVEEGGNLHLPASATAPIYLDMRVDANNWHWFTLPYNCNIADVTWVDGTPAQYNKDWFIMYYDGNSRANEQSIYENHWKVYNGTTIEAGKGYIVGIQGDITHPNHTFELRFPMAAEVLTHEHTDKHVAVNAWGVNMDITPNKKGWNLVGNPYLDYYKTSENISFTGLSLIEYLGIDPVTGERLYQEGGNVPFLVTPVDGGWYEYQQELASDVEMMPFTAYFVQVGHPNNPDHTDGMELHAEFVSDHRGRMSLIRRTPQEVAGEQEPVIVRVEVANAKGESDKTTLIIDDRFTNEYEMNADFFKWFGDYYRRYTKPVLYSMGADSGKRAFNALSEQLAAQPIPLGMFAAQAGDYTFTLTRKRCDLSSVEEVWLYDATTATYTNLMQQDYTFTTAKTEGEGRFYLSVKMRQNAPTDITDIYGGNIVASAKDGQIIVGGLTDNTQLWIYDATGKLLHTEQTTNFQHVYEAPVAGTYFVRTLLAGQAQTIKVLVE